MVKSGAPPDNLTPDKYCTLWLPIEFHGFSSRMNSLGYYSLVPGLISIFLERVWVPLISHHTLITVFYEFINYKTKAAWLTGEAICYYYNELIAMSKM